MEQLKAIRPQTLQYDGSLNIAVGQKRTDINWKNKELSWSELLQRLSRTTRTREAAAEYRRMTKSKQGEIKDVGGFVGGVLSHGRRKAGNVSWRCLVTLDADYADNGLWDTFTMLQDYAAAVYSTHSHTPEKPRLRLIVPLSRPVRPDEYVAIARRVAGDIGIDLFDDTTYEPSRLMYWPSTPDDGEYVFHSQDGPWLDPDTILARYDNWQDPSEWPESSRAVTARKKLADKQGDPHEKPGMIGAFCRAHSIGDAIDTFLPDIYTACDMPNRYTYTQGSTAGGLVVYEDGKFAYSHHSTDPISGQLCNAFDLVRLHKFGELDDDVQDIPHNRLPSYLAMLELVGKDDQAKVELVNAKDEEIAEDFTVVSGDYDDTWKSQLEFSKQGKIMSTIGNAVIILENDPRLSGKMHYNEFAVRYEIDGLPWKRSGGTWEDSDDAALRYFMEKHFGLTGSTKISDAVDIVMMKHRYHPVRDYLDGLVWDEIPRVDQFLMDYLGTTEDTEYIRRATRKTLVAAVKRIYEPGCKFDYILTLRGPQGIGKTSILRRLGGSWTQENMPSMEGKEAMEQLRGYWIIELGELNAVRKSEQEAVKGFLTRQVDSYRVPYGKRLAEFPRQCIFIANTNESSFLSDPTGGRRYWPVAVTGKPKVSGGWHSLSQEVVDQIWAEAIYWYRKGEKVYFDDQQLEREATLQQKKVRKDSEKFGLVEEYLSTKVPEHWDQMDLAERRMYLDGMSDETGTLVRDRVCVAEIYCECFGGDIGKMRRMEADELHNIMMTMDGWDRYEEGTGKLFFGKLYGHQRAYVKIR